jgi:hypothetical protein
MQESEQTNVTMRIVPLGGFFPTIWASSMFKLAYTYQSLLAIKFGLLYLDLPSIILLVDVIQPLIVATRSYLASWYKYITK